MRSNGPTTALRFHCNSSNQLQPRPIGLRLVSVYVSDRSIGPWTNVGREAEAAGRRGVLVWRRRACQMAELQTLGGRPHARVNNTHSHAVVVRLQLVQA